MRLSIIASIACLSALASRGVQAQSLNLDMGDAGSGPASGFGAAAGQPGHWNVVGALTPSPQLPLSGLNGASAGVSVYGSSFLVTPNPWGGDLGGTTGDDALLLDDWLRLVSSAPPWTFLISPLQAGTYSVYVCALAETNTVGVRVNGGVVHNLTGAWPGAYVQGVTHAVETLTLGANSVLSIELSGHGIVSGVQLVRHDTPYQVTCDGSGFSPVQCPCSNAGGTGRGCGNSILPSGARLSAVGMASSIAASDTFTLSADGMPAGFGLYFQGTAASGPGAFGDGLLCVGGTLTRLGVVASTASGSTFPAPPGSALISQLGVVVAGDVRDYQLWYRDAATYCTPATFNLTNAIRVIWQ